MVPLIFSCERRNPGERQRVRVMVGPPSLHALRGRWRPGLETQTLRLYWTAGRCLGNDSLAAGLWDGRRVTVGDANHFAKWFATSKGADITLGGGIVQTLCVFSTPSPPPGCGPIPDDRKERLRVTTNDGRFP